MTLAAGGRFVAVALAFASALVSLARGPGTSVPARPSPPATPLHYAPLPAKALAAVKRTLHTLRRKGEVILPNAPSTELRLRDVG